MLPQALQRLQQPQGRPMPMSQYQQPQGMMPQQQPQAPQASQMGGMAQGGMNPQMGMQQPQGEAPQRKFPKPGKKVLDDEDYVQLIRDNYADGMDWGENAMMLRTLGGVPEEGSILDKTFRKLYDLDYKE